MKEEKSSWHTTRKRFLFYNLEKRTSRVKVKSPKHFFTLQSGHENGHENLKALKMRHSWQK
jgi:hypothetical protein